MSLLFELRVVLSQVYSKWELEGSHPLSSQIVGLLLVVQH